MAGAEACGSYALSHAIKQERGKESGGKGTVQQSSLNIDPKSPSEFQRHIVKEIRGKKSGENPLYFNPIRL